MPQPQPKIERRFSRNVPNQPVRVTRSDAATSPIIEGLGSAYNVPYDIGGYFTEIFRAGAFSQSLKDPDTDVRCFFNHSPDFPLGRQKSGTLEITEEADGLRYTCTPGSNATSQSVVDYIERGDVDGSSIGFRVIEDTWTEERDEKGRTISVTREVIKADLIDVGPVTFPANPDATSKVRTMWPEGMSAEVRSRVSPLTPLESQERRDDNAGVCVCGCPACLDSDCAECDAQECNDEQCGANGCPIQSERAKKNKTRTVDGEALPADNFLIVRDASDPTTWKLPYRFSTPEKTKTHLRNDLARFNQATATDEERADAWPRLVALCKENEIKLDSEDNICARLTDAQIAEINYDEAQAAAEARQRLTYTLSLEN